MKGGPPGMVAGTDPPMTSIGPRFPGVGDLGGPGYHGWAKAVFHVKKVFRTSKINLTRQILFHILRPRKATPYQVQ